jgi:hypothetical protein
MEPPVSVPTDSGTMRAASAAPEPDEEPLGECVSAQGLYAGP